MAEITKVGKAELITTTDISSFAEFRGIQLKFLDLSLGDFEVTTEEPTIIRVAAGTLKLTTRAPTVVQLCAGEMQIDSYSPLVVRATVCRIAAHLRESTYILDCPNYLGILASQDLELRAKSVCSINESYNWWKSLEIQSQISPTRGCISIEGVINLDFRFESDSQLYVPSGAEPIDVTPKLLR